MGVFQAEDGGVGVRRLDPIDRAERGLEGVVRLLGGNRECDVLGRDLMAVVELGALSQVEGDRQVVVGNRPAFGEIGLDFSVLIGPHQKGE